MLILVVYNATVYHKLKEKYRRNIAIDYARALAIVSIIMAHTIDNTYVQQIRNFDVILMVLVSGITFSLSNNNKNSFKHYIIKRFKQIILPTWIFITIYVILAYFVNPVAEILNYSVLIKAYLLSGGIGYLWFIKLIFFISIFSTTMLMINEKIECKSIYLGILLLIGYLSSYYLVPDFILYLSYSLIFLIGYNYNSFNIPRFIVTCVSIFFIFQIFEYVEYGAIKLNQLDKYPPGIFYITYGLAMSFLVLRFLEKLRLNHINMVDFLSRHSLWVYLWHMLAVPLCLKVFGFGYLSFLLVTFFSVTAIYIQRKLIILLDRKYNIPEIIKVTLL
ncbi:acyltransferase family protein [Vibrio cyclitrophicus]|uniref:acyltransferase family protein n=1 Tax=Vibrio cyclitrophicus TaxID=47951 RepID=UPI0002D41D67|nr:acyltransferase [Vibrio cyclitrophicus]OEE10476.1 hypothetical protein OC1_16700 [Vibrio cyclitrophicus ZF207]